MDTVTHVSAGAQQVFLPTCSCMCLCVCVRERESLQYVYVQYVCCVSSHLVALMPVLRVCSTGIRNNLFLSVSVRISPSLDPFLSPLSLFLPNTFNPPVSLLPSFVCHSLLSILIYLSSLPSFISLFIQGAPSVTFYLWHIMHVLLRWCQHTDRLATMCVIWVEERERRKGGMGGHIDHPLRPHHIQPHTDVLLSRLSERDWWLSYSWVSCTCVWCKISKQIMGVKGISHKMKNI